MSIVHLLIATTPWRRQFFRMILSCLPEQTRKPDLVHLVLDGYGEDPSAPCMLPFREWRTPKTSGPGGRWRVAKELPPETILVVLDDDMALMFAPNAIKSLVDVVEQGHAASYFGITVTGRLANIPTDEDLICGVASAFAMRAGDLEGLDELAVKMKEASGYDMLGDCGDDEALVSANLWRRGVKIKHVLMSELSTLPGTQGDQCQAQKRVATKEPYWGQRKEIARVTGWPWVCKF